MQFLMRNYLVRFLMEERLLNLQLLFNTSKIVMDFGINGQFFENQLKKKWINEFLRHPVEVFIFY